MHIIIIAVHSVPPVYTDHQLADPVYTKKNNGSLVTGCSYVRSCVYLVPNGMIITLYTYYAYTWTCMYVHVLYELLHMHRHIKSLYKQSMYINVSPN